MADIFGVFNSTNLNAIEVDGGKSIVTINNSEEVAEIEQNVIVKIASQNICTIRQDVELRVVIAAHNCITISQNVKNHIVAQNICTINQIVLSPAAQATFFDRNGYKVQVVIANRLLPDEMIAGDIQVIKEENQTNQATLGVLVQDPVGFIDEIWGQPITINVISASTSIRMFTGVVSIPRIDLINRRVSLTCTNNRDELINNNLAYRLPSTGRYSYEVMGEVVDSASEMKARLTTITQSLDFDGYNVPSFNSWFAKDVADYTLPANQIYYRAPTVTWQDRTKIKNYETINITYQYTRLYHYERAFQWVFPYPFCTFLEYQYSLPSVSMIEAAITGAGWHTPSPTVYTSVFPPGICVFGALVVAWNTDSFANTGQYSIKFDALGNIISDPNGESQYEFKPFTKQTDLSSIYTIGAEWYGATRFSQYITENYSFVVNSSQSVAQFGRVTKPYKTALKDDFDASSWEAYKVESAAPANAVSFGTNCYYFNQDTNPLTLSNAILASIDIAKADIYSTHRNTYVAAETPLKPYLELSHTVKMESDLITAKGKVQRIVHTLAISEGRQSSTEITLALFRSRGAATNTPTYVPARPTDSVVIANETITLQNHYGVENEAYTGYIGNKLNIAVAGQPPRTNVAEQFRVDTPAIPDAYRKNRDLSVNEITYDIDIPNDLLEVILPT